MKRGTIFLLLIICILSVLMASGCDGCAKSNAEAGKTEVNYSDDYQASTQIDYDNITVQVRTSSSAYFSGSIISVTAVIENKSSDYYKVAPADAGFRIYVMADGYELIPAGAVSPSDTPFILEPNGSVSVTREYKSKVMFSQKEKMLWECEPIAIVNVKISEPAVSRQAALDAELTDQISARTSFMMYGTGEEP